MGRPLSWLGFTLLVGTTAIGCDQAPVAGLDGAYRSAHFDYLFHADDAAVCPGVMDSLEEHRALLTGYLGIDAAGLPRVSYMKFRDQPEFDQYNKITTGRRPQGYADAEKVWTTVAFHEHELIHTIAVGGWGETSPFLQEGIATALSCTPSAVEVTRLPFDAWDSRFDIVPYESNPAVWALNEWKAYSLADYFDVQGIGTVGYAVAGAVVTFLLDTGGPSALRALWTSVSPSATIQDFSAAMTAVYGFSLEEAWAHLRAVRHRPCAPVWMCSFPPLADGDQGALAPSCTGKSIARTTTGGLRLHYPKFSRAVYDWFATTDGGHLPVTGVSLIACGGNPDDLLPRSPTLQYRMMDADLWLPPLATPHVVTHETMLGILGDLRPGDDTAIAYRTSSLAPATARCSEAAANVIPPKTASAIWLPNDGQTRFTRFQLQVQTRGDLYFHASLYNTSPGQAWPPDVEVSLCAGCDGDDATACAGCPLGTTDCIVRFTNRAPTPLWLRIVAGDYWDTPASADTPASGTDAVSTMQTESVGGH